MSGLADLVAAWPEGSGCREPATVVGASMGAAVALELALREPNMVAGLLLLSPIVDHDVRFESVLHAWSETEAPTSRERISGMMPWLFGRPFLAQTGKREAATAALRAMARNTPPETLRRHAAALGEWLPRLDPERDLLVVTADHGCDPTHPGTDHTREHAPLLARFEDCAHIFQTL